MSESLCRTCRWLDISTPRRNCETVVVWGCQLFVSGAPNMTKCQRYEREPGSGPGEE